MIINNVHIIDAKKNIYGNVLIKDGIIQELNVPLNNEEIIIDGRGYALMPSFVDMHCHLRDPGYTHKEDMATGMNAALKGGYTHVVAMANTNPIIDNGKMLKKNMSKSRKLDLCDLTQVCAVTKKFNEEPVDYKKLSSITSVFSNDGTTIINEKIMQSALEASKQFDFFIASHCEPEEEIVKRDMEILKKIGGNNHVCHISKKETVELIRRAKEDGLSVTCEVTPHHLFARDIEYKVNPPIGIKADQEALITAVKEGIIDICATDHAPHTPEDKKGGAPGIDNIEVAFSMYWKVFSENNISINRLSEMISLKPSLMLGLNGGEISQGKEANLVLVDLNYAHVINVNDFVSKSNNNPFHNHEIKGKVLLTMKRGVIKYDDGSIGSGSQGN